jgi:hypothetical protein
MSYIFATTRISSLHRVNWTATYFGAIQTESTNEEKRT